MGDIYVPQCAAPFWEMDKRIIHHTKIGGRLQGLHYDKEGTFKIDGEDTLPLLQPWTISSSESYAPIGKSYTQLDAIRANAPVIDTVTVAFRLNTSRKYGLFRRIPDKNTDGQKGLIEWVAAIKDAVETNVDGFTDTRLGNSVWKPIKYNVGPSNTSQLCYGLFLEIIVDLPPMDRAQRMSTLVEE